MESPFVLDATTLPRGPGAIVFEGNKMSTRKRRFLVLKIGGTVKFNFFTNDLKTDSHFTISGFKTTVNANSLGYLEELYIKQAMRLFL